MSSATVGGLFQRTEASGYWERVARASLCAACRVIPEYSSPFSRKDFTQRQLLSVLVIMHLSKTTYRGVVELLHAMPGVRDVLDLRSVPQFTTLQHFATRRCDQQMINDILARLARDMAACAGDEPRAQAADSTGIDCSCGSRYYRGKTGQNEARYVKASVAVLCGLFLPTTVIADWGPTPDAVQALTLCERAVRAVPTSDLFADRGYDLEALHVLLRETHGVRSGIPPVPRRGVVKTKYRSMMTGTIEGYGKRWHVETFISMLKRLTGPATRARGLVNPLIDTAIKALAVAIHVAPPAHGPKGVYRAVGNPSHQTREFERESA